MSSLSKEYLKAPVRAMLAGVLVDPTGDLVELALVAESVQPTTWTAGSWETNPGAVAGPEYLARLLVDKPSPGLYALWVRVTHESEVIVRKARGLVRVT